MSTTHPFEIRFPEELPVSGRREEIAQAIRDHQVVVVAGETGSGKTTQLPKICLQLGRGEQARIGHTQPRRIAARSVAERIAAELGVALGERVGYQVRFADHSSSDTRLKVMTDGILLAELRADRDLSAYDTIIIDEAHERSLNIDFLLGYLKRLLPRRPDLKVIITSATIDPERFAAHFADAQGRPAPIVSVSGRTYPVEIRYRPLIESSYDDEDGEPVVRDQTEAILAACRELVAEGPGDILVFLPGEREIRDTADALGGLAEPGGAVEIVPLFARLSAAEQHRVFASHRGRRIVLATNVAETSLTVPGIRYVVDTGVARISRYSLRSKVQRLPIEAISRASADQRSGRCGRVEAGIAIRLYSEEDFESRSEFTDPEIVRTNLASVILSMASLGLGDLARFPFLDPPDSRQVSSGVQLLEELGAFETGSARAASPGRRKGEAPETGPDRGRAGGRTGGGGADARRADGAGTGSERAGRRGRGFGTSGDGPRLTTIGRRLARLPVDPRLGRMILQAERLGVLEEVLVIAAALSLPDPRERPVEHRARADQLHARFTHPTSDFLTWLTLWTYVREQQKTRSSSAFRRMCREEHLNYLRLREWSELESQLRRTSKEIGLRRPRHGTGTGTGIDEDGIHRALLAGLLSHVGLRDPDRRDYLGARGARFHVFPGSGLFRKQPQFVMAGELVETSRLYARVNAAIKPEWAEEAGAHLVKRSYSEPHWSAKRGAVLAYERVTLYGVPLASDRRTNYGKIDPPLARELFIRHALVYGEWRTRHPFFAENRALLEQAEEWEHRARRRDLVVDEHTLFDFYDARVGAEAVSSAHFDTWWKKARHDTPDLLRFDPAMLLHPHAEEVDAQAFPDTWDEGSLRLPLSYQFTPGADDDGVSVDVPLASLNQISDQSLSWHVPGLRRELVTALIRSLPKHLRVNFVPAPDVATQFLHAVPAGHEHLLDALERYLLGRSGVVVPREAWDWTKVAAHLQPRYRVVSEEGVVLSTGKDLAALKAPLAGRFRAALDAASAQRSVTGQVTWTFGRLEESFVEQRAGHEVLGFPALIDEGDSVGFRVLGSADDQQAHQVRGLRRLVALQQSLRPADLVQGRDSHARLGLVGSGYTQVTALLEDVVLAAVGTLIERTAGQSGAEQIRDRESFDRLVAAVSVDLESEATAVLAHVERALAGWRETERGLGGSVDLAALAGMSDLQGAVAALFERGPVTGWVAEVGARRLRELPRYLAAARARAALLRTDPARDRAAMDLLAPLQQAYLNRVAALPHGQPPSTGLVEIRWMLEEWRVSLWAQSLGTPRPISQQRIRRALAAL